jgi:GNAT superfamily N-acetyltransferase
MRTPHDDPLLRWAAGQPGARIWERAGAVAVACADLSRRDRLAVSGDPPAVARLLAEVLPAVGPSFRPLGAEELLTEVAGRLPGLEVAGRFAWMDTTEPVPGETTPGVRWLSEPETPEVSALLGEAFPGSYAQPGAPGVRRWAGLRDTGGRLLAVAADAWSTPAVGFLAGVTTRPEVRGRGLASALCAFTTNELLAGRDRVALFADYWNVAALSTYRKLGFALRPVAAAHVVQPRQECSGS